MISNSLLTGTWFLDGVRTLEARTAKTQRQISSGYRLQDAADSPLEAPGLIALGTTVDALKHYVSNLGRVSAEISTADTALTSAIQLTDRARTLALQASGTTVTAAARASAAVEIKSLQQQLVGLTNTSAEGRFVFGGDQDQSPPYAYSAAAARGVDALTPQLSTRRFQDPSGLDVFTADSAAEIFDHSDATGAAAPDNVFAAFQNLLTSLNSNDQAGVSAALTQLQDASSWLNQKQASYGAAANRVSSETESASTLLTTLQARISAIRDTDVVQAATDLALENVAQSAAFSAQASVPRKSLFDYLG